jgi:hypothetical protein
MAVGAGVAMLTDLGEQDPHRGGPFSPSARQERPEICRGADFWCHCIALRHSDEPHPTLDAATAQSELPGDLPDRPASLEKGSDLIEQGLACGVPASLC